jgi:hypothetical protein
MRAWILAVAGLLSLVFLGSALARTGEDPPKPKLPPYVVGPWGYSFSVQANALWKGAVVKELVTPGPEPTAVVWAKTCTHAAQTATFTRTLKLLGAPGDASFAFAGLTGAFASPVESVDLKVNGKLLASQRLSNTTRNFTKKLDPKSMRSAFRDGDNEVEVRVTRGALPATVKSCNAGKGDARDNTHLGVELTLSGTFAADGAVDKKPAALFEKVSLADHYSVRGVYRLRNNGPSAASVGEIMFSASGVGAVVESSSGLHCVPGTSATIVSEGVPGLAGSSVFIGANNAGSYTINCYKADFKPGEVETVTILLSQNGSSSDFSEESLSAGAHAVMFGPSELDQSNNQANTTVTFCGKLSTRSECTSASSTPGF